MEDRILNIENPRNTPSHSETFARAAADPRRMVIRNEVEEPLIRRRCYASRRDPSTEFILSEAEGLRMTRF
jgi:hypothetical protein